jgi:Tfp pilus assembly protein PilO
MFKFLIPTILIGTTVAMFFIYTSPLYQEVMLLREEMSAYNEALSNSKALENERDKLTQKYNAIGGENLNKLQKLLPESVDNIRLVLELEKLALPYGMVLKDVKYDATQKESTASSGVIQGEVLNQNFRKDYGVWSLGFSTEGSYSNFINFLKDIENNLRIVDVTSVSFSSSAALGSLSDVYKYNLQVKTYWLKN